MTALDRLPASRGRRRRLDDVLAARSARSSRSSSHDWPGRSGPPRPPVSGRAPRRRPEYGLPGVRRPPSVSLEIRAALDIYTMIAPVDFLVDGELHQRLRGREGEQRLTVDLRLGRSSWRSGCRRPGAIAVRDVSFDGEATLAAAERAALDHLRQLDHPVHRRVRPVRDLAGAGRPAARLGPGRARIRRRVPPRPDRRPHDPGHPGPADLALPRASTSTAARPSAAARSPARSRRSSPPSATATRTPRSS